MEVKHIQTMLFEANESEMHWTKPFQINESQTHSNKAFWREWKSNAFNKDV